MDSSSNDVRLIDDEYGAIRYSTKGVDDVTSDKAKELCQRLKPDSVRVYGTLNQAPMIMDLFAYKQEFNESMQIFIGGRAAARCTGRHTGHDALRKMSMLYNLPAYLGGWQEMRLNSAQQRVYQFLSDYKLKNRRPGGLHKSLPLHPGYPAAAFLGAGTPKGCPADCVADVLAVLEEPRWYHQNSSHPERESALRSTLGITPSNVRSTVAGKRATGFRHDNYNRFIYLLYNTDQPDLLDTTTRLAGQLFRHRGGENTQVTLLRTLEFCASLLRQSWLHEMAEQGRELFIPEYFFEQIKGTPNIGSLFAERFKRDRATLPARASDIIVPDHKI